MTGRKSLALLEYESSDHPKEEVVDLRLRTSAMVQSFDPGACPSHESLKFIIEQTEEAARCGQLLARSREVDFLMRLAGTDQIDEAFRRAGVKPRSHALLAIFGTPLQVRRDVATATSILKHAVRYAPPKETPTTGVKVRPEEISALLGLKRLRVNRKSKALNDR